MGSSKKTKVGYKYLLGWHSVLCQGGLDAILKIKYADRVAWEGAVSTNQNVYINKPKLLGGDKREGGWVGNVDFMFGGGDQPVNPYLAFHSNRSIIPGYFSAYEDLGGATGWAAYLTANSLTPNEDIVANGGVPVPAYRGVQSLLFKHFEFASMNPYMKNMSVTVRRIPQTLGATNATIVIDGRHNANPAHIVYDVLTNSMWGLGFGIDSIDVTSFTEAAAALHAEGFGLSLAWVDEGTAEEFVNLIIAHIGGTLYPAPDSGKYTLKLYRDDEDPEDAMLLDPSNVVAVRSFQRAASTDLVNEITLEYHDPSQDKAAKVTVQNPAAIRSVGRVIRKVIKYPGIRNADLAARVALRELREVSTPLAKMTLETNLQTWNLRPGSLFRFSWPKLKVAAMVFRVIDIEFPDVRGGRILINAIEDIFSLPSASYLVNVPPVWSPVANDLVDITAYKIFEMPYFFVIQNFGEDYASYLADNRNFTGVIAARKNGLWTGYEVQENIGGGTYEFRLSGSFCAWVMAANALTRFPTDNTISYEAFYDDETVEVGYVGVIDDEWVQVTAIDTVAKTVTVERAVLDTVPVEHAIGARLWLFEFDAAADYDRQRLSGETVTYKLLPETGDEILPIGSATARSHTLVGRQERPYPPGNVKLNGEYFPATVTDDITITLAHRDRTLQTVDPIAWNSASISLESGAAYTVQYYRTTDNVLLYQQTGITAATFTHGETELGQEANLRVELFAVKSAANSFQKLVHSFTRISIVDLYACLVLADGPLGFWRLNEASGVAELKDSSGNNRHATANAVTALATALTVPTSTNKATAFNGTSAYAAVPYAAALATTTALTVEMWIKIAAFPGTGVNASIISKMETGGYGVYLDGTAALLAFSVRRNGGDGVASYATSNLTIGVAYHVVGTFDGRYTRLYVDGVLVSTDDAGSTYAVQYSVTNGLLFGAEPAAAAVPASPPQYFNGTLDEISVCGIAIAASEILARYRSGTNLITFREDPFWDKTTLLLHMNGADTSTVFTDEKGNTVSVFGNAQITTAQSKFGGASGSFDGTGDYITAPTGSNFQLPADFTVEFWIRPTTVAASLRYIFDNRSGTSSATGFIIYQTLAELRVFTGGVDVMSVPAALTINTWHHVALTRRGNVMRLFVNGTLRATYISAANFSDGRFCFGTNVVQAQYFTGQADDVRVTKACRYTRNFTLPVEAFPNQGAVVETTDTLYAETVALLHMDGANGSTTFTDEKGHTFTASGTAQLSTAQARFGTASLYVGTSGSNYIRAAADADFIFGTSDFTVEGWFRPSISGDRYFYVHGLNTVGGMLLAVSTNKIIFRRNGTTDLVYVGAVSSSAWTHIAFVRSGDTSMIFVNGALVTSASLAFNVSDNVVTDLGASGQMASDTFRYYGYIDDFRVTKGIARYAEAFAPPKLPFPNA